MHCARLHALCKAPRTVHGSMHCSTQASNQHQQMASTASPESQSLASWCHFIILFKRQVQTSGLIYKVTHIPLIGSGLASCIGQFKVHKKYYTSQCPSVGTIYIGCLVILTFVSWHLFHTQLSCHLHSFRVACSGDQFLYHHSDQRKMLDHQLYLSYWDQWRARPTDASFFPPYILPPLPPGMLFTRSVISHGPILYWHCGTYWIVLHHEKWHATLYLSSVFYNDRNVYAWSPDLQWSPVDAFLLIDIFHVHQSSALKLCMMVFQ